MATCLTLLACTGTGAEPHGGDGAGAAPPPRHGGGILFGVVGSPATLDPYSPVASDLTRALVRPVYPSLFRLLPDGSTEPYLARSIDSAGDRVTVHLGRGRWSDGRTITARDVVASMRRAHAPSGFSAFDGAHAASADTVIFRGRVHDPRLALAVAAYILPEGRAQTPGGSFGGPFRLVDYRPGLELEYARNPRWTGGGPFLAHATVTFVDGVRTLLALLERKRLDGGAPTSTVNLDRIVVPGTTVTGRLGWETAYLDFTGSGLEVPERAGLARRLDRRAMEEAFVRDGGRVANTLAPGPGAGGAQGPWARPLDRGAIPDETVRVTAPEGDELLELVQRAAYAQLTRGGLDVELVAIDPQTLYGAWRSGGPADVVIRRAAGAPAFARTRERPHALTRYPLFQVESYVAYRRGVHDVAASGTVDGPLWDMQEWWVERGAGRGG